MGLGGEKMETFPLQKQELEDRTGGGTGGESPTVKKGGFQREGVGLMTYVHVNAFSREQKKVQKSFLPIFLEEGS